VIPGLFLKGSRGKNADAPLGWITQRRKAVPVIEWRVLIPRPDGESTLKKCNLSRGIVLSIAVAVWLTAMSTGFYQVMVYEFTPGPSGQVPVSWPTGSRLLRVENVPNLLIAVHPKCPCTRSSLAVLEDILQHSPAGASIRLLVYRPIVAAADWEDSPLPPLTAWPGVERVDDPGGFEAARFGLVTSGATVAFDAAGHLRFAGGLNASRGRSEMSGGGLALLAILGGEEPRSVAAEAYGCPIRAEATVRGASGVGR
jgi:hypothetical protein